VVTNRSAADGPLDRTFRVGQALTMNQRSRGLAEVARDSWWTRAEELEREAAARDGRKPNITAYVEEAIRRENKRVERALRRAAAPPADA
jgi:hypothetical protein